MKTLRPRLSCHCFGVAISRVFGGCGLFLSDPISVPDGDLGVRSDFLSGICQCTSRRMTGLKAVYGSHVYRKEITCIIYRLNPAGARVAVFLENTHAVSQQMHYNWLLLQSWFFRISFLDASPPCICGMAWMLAVERKVHVSACADLVPHIAVLPTSVALAITILIWVVLHCVAGEHKIQARGL